MMMLADGGLSVPRGARAHVSNKNKWRCRLGSMPADNSLMMVTNDVHSQDGRTLILAVAAVAVSSIAPAETVTEPHYAARERCAQICVD